MKIRLEGIYQRDHFIGIEKLSTEKQKTSKQIETQNMKNLITTHLNTAKNN